jgi:hypothetical protein
MVTVAILRGDGGAIHMRRLITVAIAATMASLFAVMFWSQVGAIATTVARPKPEPYAVKSNPYLPIQTFEAVY